MALVIIPVFSATFIRIGPDRKNNMPNKKRGYVIAGSLMALGGLFYLLKWNTAGSLSMIFGIIGLSEALLLQQSRAVVSGGIPGLAGTEVSENS